jgi:hypothetical protein
VLDQYAFVAELTAYCDPNTSLMKTRQVAEVLAKSTAAHAGMDCADNTFDETIGLLKRQRIIPMDVFWKFDHVRLDGNEAAHKHKREPTAALQSLICAHELAKWFKINVLNDLNFRPEPFKPLPKPVDASVELRKEIDFLRDEVARSQLAADASESQVKELSEKLEREAIAYKEIIRDKMLDVMARDNVLARLQKESKQRLKELAAVAESKTFQSFVTRSRQSAMRLGKLDSDSLPLTQLRITTGANSWCCGAPYVIVQSMGGGWVSKNCVKCNRRNKLSVEEFVKLHICVLCGNCGNQTQRAIVGKNYGYECSCGWKCELAAVVPHYLDNAKQS